MKDLIVTEHVNNSSFNGGFNINVYHNKIDGNFESTTRDEPQISSARYVYKGLKRKRVYNFVNT